MLNQLPSVLHDCFDAVEAILRRAAKLHAFLLHVFVGLVAVVDLEDA